MVLLYMVCHGSHQYTPVMLAYIPSPWIRHGIVNQKMLEAHAWNPRSIKTKQSSKVGKWECNVVKSIVNQRMVHYCFNSITRKWGKKTWDMTGKAEDNLDMFWKTSQLGIYWKILYLEEKGGFTLQ